MNDYLLFLGVVVLVLAVLFRLGWVLAHTKKRIGARVGVGLFALVGALILLGGMRRHLDHDDSYRPGGKYGPQAWYQDVGAGGLLLVAALAASVTLTKNEKTA